MDQRIETAAAGTDSGIAAVRLVARLFGIATDAEQIKHQFGMQGKPFTLLDMLRALHSLQLKAKQSRWSIERLQYVPLPAIVQHANGTFQVLLKVSDTQVLLHDPTLSKPLIQSRDVFVSQYKRELILAAKRASLPGADVAFGMAWFWSVVGKYRRMLVEVLIASAFVQLFALLTPLFFQVMIDKVLVHKSLNTLDVLAVGLSIVYLFEVILNGLRAYVFSHTSNRIDVELGAKLFKHLLSLPMSYYEARRVGDSVARVRELENIRNFITGSSITVIIDVMFTLVFFAAMYWYSPLLTLIVGLSLPLYGLTSGLITPLLRKRLQEKFSRGAEHQAFLVESVAGIETLKAMAVEPQMQQRWEEQLAEYVRTSFQATQLGNVASQLACLISKLSVVLILWFGARLVIDGRLSVGQLIAFNMLAARVSGPILRLAQIWMDFQQAGISLQRLGDILAAKPESMPVQHPSQVRGLQGSIRFDQVTFRYRPGLREALRDVTLDISAGTVVGIVGRSGSGKSTLTKLLQKMHVAEHGRILLDGIDLAAIDPVWLRRNIGVVLQENRVFNRSIRDNIALADAGVGMDRIVRAATLVGAHEFIMEMPDGYDTVVEEQGSNLSGGQKQRIAIARALVTDPKLLILDEATSALDYESEQLLQENMRSICAGRTVIIIAHRLSTVSGADRIIVMDHGRIAEQGHHYQLIKNQGIYAKLYAAQSAVRGISMVN